MKQRRSTTLILALATGISLHNIPKNIAGTGEPGRIRSILNLYQLLHLLPLELLQIIVDLAWQCFFFTPVAVFQESCNFNYLSSTRSASIELVSSQYIFLGCITYSNIRYISYLSNQRRAPSDEILPLTYETYQLKLAVDDIGIRDICFLDKNKHHQMPNWLFCAPKNRVMYQTPHAGNNSPVQHIKSVTDVC